MVKCPNCGLLNSDQAQRCDCGYDFVQKELKASYQKTDIIKGSNKKNIVGISLLFTWLILSIITPFLGIFIIDTIGKQIFGIAVGFGEGLFLYLLLPLFYSPILAIYEFVMYHKYKAIGVNKIFYLKTVIFPFILVVSIVMFATPTEPNGKLFFTRIIEELLK